MTNVQKMLAELKTWIEAHFSETDEEALVSAAGIAAKAAISAIPMPASAQAVANGLVAEAVSIASKPEEASQEG